MRERSRMKTKTEKRVPLIIPSTSKNLSSIMTEWSTELEIERKDASSVPISEKTHHAYVQTFEGNPEIPTPVIREAYFTALTQATKTIDITTPYFAPDEDIIMALKTAVSRGVRVRLLVPRRGNQKMVGNGPALLFMGNCSRQGFKFTYIIKECSMLRRWSSMRK